MLIISYVRLICFTWPLIKQVVCKQEGRRPTDLCLLRRTRQCGHNQSHSTKLEPEATWVRFYVFIHRATWYLIWTHTFWTQVKQHHTMKFVCESVCIDRARYVEEGWLFLFFIYTSLFCYYCFTWACMVWGYI